MTNAQNIFVTITKNGPRYYTVRGLRRFPISTAKAEAAFAAGATIVRCEKGETWIKGQVIGA